MRADRLLAALLLLQARERVTARELAAELEVSVATARRDLEALSTAGVPVYPTVGRGGGWRLVGGARTDLTGLSASEAQTLFLMLGPAAALSVEAKAALRKLLRAVPATFRSDAEAAAVATVVDPAAWGGREPREAPPVVALLNTGVVRRRRVRLDYASRTRDAGERLVDPLGTVEKDGVWYLIAGTDAGQRTFRVDRIASAELTDDPATRPVDFDLGVAWAQVVAELEDRRARTWATVLIDPRHLAVLRDHFGRHCEEVGLDSDGRARVRVAAPTPLDLARNLAGWGQQVEVTEPATVRRQLARISSELGDLYVGGPDAGSSPST